MGWSRTWTHSFTWTCARSPSGDSRTHPMWTGLTVIMELIASLLPTFCSRMEAWTRGMCWVSMVSYGRSCCVVGCHSLYYSVAGDMTKTDFAYRYSFPLCIAVLSLKTGQPPPLPQPSENTVFITGTAHCADMRAMVSDSKATDPLYRGQRRIQQQVACWLSAPGCEE